MSKLTLKLFVLFFFMVFQISTQAQLNVTLDSVEVKATKIPSTIFKTGKSITVLDSKTIGNLPVNSVDELLRYVAGVNVNARQGFGVQSDISLRGSTFAQVLFVVDDVRTNDPLTAHFNNNVPIALSEIASIEIVRGPAAAAYGADAVGGLVHIKTKTYLAKASNKSEFNTNGEFGLGSNNYGFSDMAVTYNNEKWYASASVKTNIAKGEELVNLNFINDGPAEDSLFYNYFNVKTYSAAVTHFLDDKNKIYARLGYDDRDFSAKYFYTANPYDESTEQTNSLWSQIGFSRNDGDHTSSANIALKSTNDLFIFNPLFTPNEHTTNQLVAEGFHYYQLSNSTKLGGGLQYINKSINSTDRGNHSTNNIALYANGQSKFKNDFTANASFRAEYDTNFGFEILPQFSLAYFLNDSIILRGSLGKSIRAADFTERYVSSQIPNLSELRNIGNPDLEAERSWSFELGADYYGSENLKANVTTFFRTGNNLIDYVVTNADDITNATNLQAGLNYFYPTNLSKSNTFGIELGVQKKWLFYEHLNIDGQFNYTLLATSSAGNEPSKYISNHPTHNFNIWVTLRYQKFLLNTINNLIIRDSDFSETLGIDLRKSYLLSNFRFAYKFNEKLTPFVKVNNLFNTQYSDILGVKMPSQWWMLGIAF